MSILWQPSPERVAAARLTAFTAMLGKRAGRTFADYAALHRSDCASEPVLDRLWDFCGFVPADPAVGRSRNRGHARRALLPGRAAQLRGEPAAPRRRGAGDHRHRRRRRRPPLSWRALTAPCGAPPRASRRPASGRAIACAAHGERARRRSSRRSARRRSAPSGRRARRTSARRACSIASARSSRRCSSRRRLPLRRQAVRLPRRRCRGGRAAADARAASCVVDGPATSQTAARPARAIGWDEWLRAQPADRRSSSALPFDHPLYILYSSGTTGVPKCIVHGAGGTLLQHLKEHQLHCDIRAGDRVFYFTTCGWMMWNWLVSALASGATLVLYDGSPFHPGRRRAVRSRRRDGRRRSSARRRSSSTRSRKAGLEPRDARTRCDRAAHDHVDRDRRWRRRASTSSTARSSATCTSRRSPAAPTSSAASSAATRTAPVWRGEIQARGARHGGRRVRRGGPRRVGTSRASSSARAVSVDAARLLERPGRRAVPRRVLRAVSRRLAPRRLGRS